jgi:glutamate N-acetyltransferase/amino-acid N-acetyltransferase
MGKDIQIIEGGITAPKGFIAGGIHAGIRRNKTKNDLALIVSEIEAAGAGLYTRNLVKGAPLDLTKKHLLDGKARAIICNSGNANTCAANGKEIAEKTAKLTADALGIPVDQVLVASTGVIGEEMEIEPFERGIPKLVEALGKNSDEAAEAILTTDTKKKEIAVSFELDGRECRIGAIAKGSGMIHPDMATMLVFITTDCFIVPDMLHKALTEDVATSFNMLSVDGDTSTNDMVLCLANGAAGNDEITKEGEAFSAFMKALNTVTVYLCRAIAADGEGMTKLLECKVRGAKDIESAKLVAKNVICSSLVKTAMFGADSNWGRVLCAIGYSGADVDVDKIELAYRSKAGSVTLCKDGLGIPYSEETAKSVLLEDEIEILIDLHDGDAKSVAWGCDLTYDYVRINGDYRT